MQPDKEPKGRTKLDKRINAYWAASTKNKVVVIIVIFMLSGVYIAVRNVMMHSISNSSRSNQYNDVRPRPDGSR